MSPRLLPSLARVVRGLSALFWGIPAALLLETRAVISETWISFGVMPLLIVTGMLVFGVWQLRDFQSQERVWRAAVDRAQILAIALFGLAPFAHWSGRRPDEPFLQQSVLLTVFLGLLFLLVLNHTLVRLSAMLPDETLRSETRFFSALNSQILLLLGGLLFLFLFLRSGVRLPVFMTRLEQPLAAAQIWHILLPVLLPVALTMTMLWKTREVILASVFSDHR